MSEATRVGIIGAGAIAQLAHLPALARMRGVEVVALCDADRPKARSLADRFNVPDTFTDIDDLLELEELDAVVVATPNHLHEPQVMAALAAGVDVLCERPVALSARGVERILATANRYGRKIIVGNNHRFRTDVQALERFIRGGELGKVTGIRAGAYHFKRPGEGWRMRRAESGGGAFFDHGTPMLDLALWIAESPEVERVSASMERGRGASAVEDSMHVTLVCASGMVTVIDVTHCYVGQEERWWFEVLATRGSGRLAPLRVVKELNGRASDVSPSGAAGRESAFLQSYRAELAHFVAVVQGTVPYDPPSDQVRVHKVIEAIYRSAEEGKEIRL
ncbi:MAG TPA: Gfo/Idh/MocA family oxidoreductase [Gemmatimonadaceae bacterium]|nr:Gfo/Idh/MocA family oxidoreductase [Gemmatimonadaceae bacterium]